MEQQTAVQLPVAQPKLHDLLVLWGAVQEYMDLEDRDLEELDDEALGLVNEARAMLEGKLLAYGGVIKAKRLEADWWDTQAGYWQQIADEMKARSARLTRDADWLSTRALNAMHNAGIDVVDNGKTQLKIAKVAPALHIPNEELALKELPEEFVRVIPEKRAIDKKAVLDAMKAGKEFPFIDMDTSRTRLSIK